jgi:phosphoserine phosphatase RsbU/P
MGTRVRVGGDYYDVFALDDDRPALCAGDVCGKGLSAALLVSSLQATVRACAAPDHAPHETMARVPCGAVPAGCPWPVHHPRARRGRHARPHPAVLQRGPQPPVRAGGTVSRLDTGGLAAGIFDTATYDSGRISLSAGDRLLFFTDGLAEAGIGSLRELTASGSWTRRCAIGTVSLLSWSSYSPRCTPGPGPRLEDNATALPLGVGA